MAGPCTFRIPNVLLGLALAAGLACSSGGADGADLPVNLPGDLTPGGMTAAERQVFCAWASDPGARCEALATDGQPPGSGESGEAVTPLQACLDGFQSLPECPVATYQACHEKLLDDPCGAVSTDACKTLSTCPATPSPPANGGTYIAWEYKSFYFSINESWSCEFSKLLTAPIWAFWLWGTWDSFSLVYTNSSVFGYSHRYPTVCYDCWVLSGSNYHCETSTCGVSGAKGDSGDVVLAPGVSRESACNSIFKALNLRCSLAGCSDS